jgi:uncharacterized protein (DUF1786 family)
MSRGGKGVIVCGRAMGGADLANAVVRRFKAINEGWN